VMDYRVTVTNANGCTATDSMHLSLLALPGVNLGADRAVCTGDSISLGISSVPGDHYLWNSGDTTSQILASAAGNYVLSVTDAQGCQNQDSVALGNLALPVVALGADTVLCPSVGLNLDAGNAGMSYAWSHGPVTQVTNVQSAGSYAVTVTDGQGCLGTDTIVLTNFAAPLLLLPDTATACNGDSVSLTPGIVAASYLWNTGSSNSTLTVNAAGIYYVDVIDTHGCAGSDTSLVVLNNGPAVSLGPDTVNCVSDPAVVLAVAQAGLHYLWSTGDTTQQISVSTGGIISVTVTDANGCQGLDTIALTRLLAVPVNLGADTAICQGDSLLLTAAGPFVSLLWNGQVTADTIFAATAGTWSVVATDTNGCTASDTIALAINALPNPQLGADTTICEGTTYTLHAGVPGSYLWSDNSTAESLAVSVAAQYAVTVTLLGCSGSDAVVVEVQPSPTPDLGPDIQVCPGDTVAIGLSGFASYAWSTGAHTDSIWVSQAQTYLVTVTDALGCTGQDTLALSLAPSPALDLQNLLPEYCQTDPASLLVGTPANGVFGGAANASGVFDPATAGLGVVFVSYAFTDTLQCTWLIGDSTVVTAPPSQANAGPDLAQGGQIILQASAPAIGVGHWEVGSLPCTLSDIHDPNAMLTTAATGSFPIVWVVENAPCAPTRDTLKLELDALFVPTGFSPNGDGTNDVYFIRGLDQYPDAKLSIYNRWGSLVWQSPHYHNEWTGCNAQGQPLVDDTYYIILEYSGKALNTFVVLARQP
jgi:gliding motility-associated-like protein